MADRTPEDVWKENNEEFGYDYPDDPPELWSPDEYTELYDRVIMRDVTWVCQKCNKPCRSLEQARRHVENQHSSQMLEKATWKAEEADS